MLSMILLMIQFARAEDCVVHCTDLGDCFKQCSSDTGPRACTSVVYDDDGKPTDCTVAPLPVIDSTRGPSASLPEGEVCVAVGAPRKVIVSGDARCRWGDQTPSQALFTAQDTSCTFYEEGRAVRTYAGQPQMNFLECYSP